MKQRLTAFTLIWAYVACALWLPQAVPETSSVLYLFPPGYFFVVGLVFGLLNESLAMRLNRLWVTIVIMATSCEIGILLYGGHSTGLLLGLLFAIATLCASSLARFIAGYKPLLNAGAVLGSLLVVSWLVASRWYGFTSTKSTVSHDGAFRAWLIAEHGGEISILYVGPRYGWHGAFGRVLLTSGVLIKKEKDYKVQSLEDFTWQNTHTLHITGTFSDSQPGPTALLPISLHATRLP